MPLWKLVGYKVKIALSVLTRGKAGKRVPRIIGLAGLAFLMVLMAVGAAELFGALKSFGPTGAQAAAAILTLTFHGVLIIAFVFDIATTTNIFFLSSDLDLLMAAPLSTSKVFAVKYLEAMAAGSLVAVFLAVPVAAGYGLAFNAPAAFYPALLAVTAIFLSIPISFGTIVGMVISRVVRASKVKEVLSVFSGLVGLAIWVGFNAVKPSPGNIQELQDISSRVTALASGGSLLNLLPGHLPAEVLTALASPAKWRALHPLVALSAIACVAFALSIVVAQRIYLSGWTRSAAAGRKARRVQEPAVQRRAGPNSVAALIWRGLPAAERSILVTTARLLAREPQQVTPIFTIVIMMALFPFFTGRGGLMRPEVVLYSLSMVSFAGSMNLATNALLVHGRSFWRLLMAPMSPKGKMWSLVALSASFFIPLAAAIAVVFRLAGVVAWPFVLKAVCLSACFTLLGSSIGLLVAVTFGDWEWDTPKRMLRASGRLVALGAVMVVFAGMGIAVGSLSKTATLSEARMTWPVLAGAAALSGLLSYLMLTASAARVRRMEWTA